MKLESERLQLTWARSDDGWAIQRLAVKGPTGWIEMPQPSGRHTVLFINRRAAVKLVEMDKEGTAFPFFPAEATAESDGSISFRQTLPTCTVSSLWSIDPKYATDIRVRITLTAKEKGSFSIASPTLCIAEPNDITWGMVPGNWYGNDIQSNTDLSPGYSQGIPNHPHLTRERNTMTLCPLLSQKNGVSYAVIPEPGTSQDPWEQNANTRNKWHVGVSTMDRYEQLTPVAYSPVLGEDGSAVEAGESLTFNFRYTLDATDWFAVFRHAARDIYRLPEILSLQISRESLSDRVNLLGKMLADDAQCRWKLVTCNGVQIGANGTKTSDIGAMWMLARTSEDATLNSRLQFLRNYKLQQQQTIDGFFQYAATGEYPERDGFVAERGNWIEPLFTTYYTMLDMGNIALFQGDDREIRNRIRLAAEKLISWQKADGSWDVAYDAVSHRPAFTSLQDLRPTWYGLFVAYRVLGDANYLAAAKRGADWYVANAVDRGHFLGACGDALNIWDFTTVFGAQAMLDLADATGDDRYKQAAIRTAKIYATTIFTQPIATDKTKTVAGVERKDWEISQVGLSVEHIRGTASSGPIMLSSHAGLFVRMHELTGDPLFLEMARAAARGRHHWVDPQTGMSIYYWSSIDNVDNVVKLFPWHAEWQVGWITDYLLSEAHLRSGGKISFPAGFPTPKVGSHVTYGFKPGEIFGRPASLWSGHTFVRSDNPNSEYLSAVAVDRKQAFLIALNQFPKEQEITLTTDRAQHANGKSLAWSAGRAVSGDLLAADAKAGTVKLKLAPWGIAVVALDLP